LFVRGGELAEKNSESEKDHKPNEATGSKKKSANLLGRAMIRQKNN
jgi:hypothetical protein